jgi:hypothetical protein
VEGKERQGAPIKTAIFFLSPLIQNREGRGGGSGCQRAGPWQRPGDGAKRRGARGQPIQPLTLVRDELWRWLFSGGRLQAVVVVGGGASKLGMEGELAMAV